MGFAVWIDDDLVWAQGTHEYRPMGVAVIGRKGVFATRDFNKRRTCPHRYDPSFAGFFASLGQINVFLKTRRKRSTGRAMAIL